MPRLAITIGKGANGFPAAKQHVWAGTWDSPLLDIARYVYLAPVTKEADSELLE